jgi:hypothetical protein
MSSIKLILTFLCLGAFVLSTVAFRSKLGLRLATLCSFFAAAWCVIFPDSTTRVANALGVGRGADLLLYLGLFAGINALLMQYMRTRRLERKLTEHIRATAIMNAIKPGELRHSDTEENAGARASQPHHAHTAF